LRSQSSPGGGFARKEKRGGKDQYIRAQMIKKSPFKEGTEMAERGDWLGLWLITPVTKLPGR